MDDRRDLMRRIARAGSRVDPALTDRDVDRLVAGAERRRAQRARLRHTALAAAAVGSLVVTGALVLRRPNGAPQIAASPGLRASPQLAPPPDGERMLHLADGSTAVPLDPESEIVVVEEHPDRVGLSLVRGRGRFEVTPQPKRTFLVRAGDVTVAVVGTAFTVERVADRVGVAVQRGTVRVDWGTGSALVTAGQSGWYPPLVTTGDRDGSKPATAPHVLKAKAASRPSAPADKGEAAAALLLAADRARLAGRPSEGAELLQKLLRDHSDDPRAPLAAFTLGRLMLMDLRRPGEAASAFAEARRLSPDGPFAEDALAREVEALSKAGRAADARARAADYERLYPNGRRVATVRAAGASP